MASRTRTSSIVLGTGFTHFDYVNPEAPKGGTVRQISVGTFDNFNLTVAGVKGSLAGAVQTGAPLITTTGDFSA